MVTVARNPLGVTRPVPLSVLFVLLLVTVAWAGAGCTTRTGPTEAGPDPVPGEVIPPSFEPIVIPRQNRGDTPAGGIALRGDERPVSADDAGWAEKHDLAAGYAAGGHDEAAFTVIREVLALKPPAAWRQRFVNLRTSLRLRRVEADWLRVQARGVKDYVTFGSDADWQIRIRNVSDRALVLRAPKSGPGRASPSAMSLGIVRRDIDIYGAELERAWNQTVFLQRAGGCDIRIPPGCVHEATVRIPAGEVGCAISGLRLLEITGTLRAVVTEEDGSLRTIALRIRRGRVIVLPEGYEPLARDPLASLRTAIDAVAPTHLLIATEFVPRAQSDRAMELLAGALATGDPALRTAVMGGLGLLRDRNVGRPLARFINPLVDALEMHPERGAALMEALTLGTGQALAPDPRLWMDWWRRAGESGIRVPAFERSSAPGTPREER